ncbi:UPF0545 protein C22orf39 homolog [Lingula anatina]|uniref:Synaptic plasticity regulator PANTS n=1 Tax=Lingula anatina TaxID=7574 RepID=A0A1S3JKN7_LINAN|nr:UPF0545 protein C22orf39 homolog [Lingula anatina]|eukprot:XP_013410691.1 UPF0545 protein C22orf39 homolog [Lingula anatina]
MLVSFSLESMGNSSNSQTSLGTAGDEAEKENSICRKKSSLWPLRNCDYYKTEFESCNAYKSKVFQRFVYGHTQDCSKWKDYYESCLKFETSKDEEDVANLLEAERERREEWMEGSKANDVWEYRDKPPEEWEQPWDRAEHENRHFTSFFKEYREQCRAPVSKDGKPSNQTKLTPDVIQKGPKITRIL